MKILWSILATTFLLFSICNAQNTVSTSWKEFVSEEGKFKATFPDTPKQSVEDLNIGTLKRQNHWFEVNLPQKYFAVCYADYPTLPEMNQDALKKNYDFLRDTLLKSTGFKLIAELDISLDGKSGREITFSGGDEIVIDRMFLIDRRLYQSITSIKDSLKDDAKTKANQDKFHNSFQIAEK